MKKLLSGFLAGAVALTALFGAAACGEKNEPPEEKADREAPAFASPGATLSLTGAVNTDEGSRISADLFGLFLEDINYASYALDDNLVCNGSFEYAKNRTYAWTGTSATVTTASGEDKLHANNQNYAKVNAQANGKIVNTGYPSVPIAVDYDVDYTFSAFVKNYGGGLTVRVKGTRDNTVYAEKKITVTDSADWVKYQTTVKGTGTARENLALELEFDTADADICLDSVSFETSDSTVGIKNYLYRAIADLSPAFFRFPGGCVIEGKSMESAYDWKNSVGAEKAGSNDELNAFSYTLNVDGTVSNVTTYGEQATRVANTDIWQNGNNYYEMEYGIGFYEYFQLCETLGAKAIPIVNCGLSCQPQTPGGGVALAGRHGNGVSDYIQDAIDLLYFAKGDVNSSDADEAYWANARKNMGHPEPFVMEYIGVGNEQWGEYYKDYYEKFLEDETFQAALKKFGVQPVVGNCTMFTHCEDPATHRTGVAQNAANNYMRNGKIDAVSEYGVHDQHYYMNYTDFLANAAFYDGYKRPATHPDEYYDVFVGEYSANSAVTRSGSTQAYLFENNSMITALSEAAMMTGYERNGDIVKLAAYAPMFGIIQERGYFNQWAVDMMYFNNTQLVLTPNYYVQQIFMKNSGDYKVTSSLAFTGEKPQTTYNGYGVIVSGGVEQVNKNETKTRTLDDVYFVTSRDAETGDVIVKIVNVGGTEIDMNIDVALEGVTLKGIADVTVISAESGEVVNALEDEKIAPQHYTAGSFNTTMGYKVLPYSLTAIRFRTK